MGQAWSVACCALLPGKLLGSRHGVHSTGALEQVACIPQRRCHSMSTLLQWLCSANAGPGVFLMSCCLLQRLPVGQVVAGQTAALALKKIKRGQVGGQHSLKALPATAFTSQAARWGDQLYMLVWHTVQQLQCIKQARL